MNTFTPKPKPKVSPTEEAFRRLEVDEYKTKFREEIKAGLEALRDIGIQKNNGSPNFNSYRYIIKEYLIGNILAVKAVNALDFLTGSELIKLIEENKRSGADLENWVNEVINNDLVRSAIEILHRYYCEWLNKITEVENESSRKNQ